MSKHRRMFYMSFANSGNSFCRLMQRTQLSCSKTIFFAKRNGLDALTSTRFRRFLLTQLRCLNFCSVYIICVRHRQRQADARLNHDIYSLSPPSVSRMFSNTAVPSLDHQDHLLWWRSELTGPTPQRALRPQYKHSQSFNHIKLMSFLAFTFQQLNLLNQSIRCIKIC